MGQVSENQAQMLPFTRGNWKMKKIKSTLTPPQTNNTDRQRHNSPWGNTECLWPLSKT